MLSKQQELKKILSKHQPQKQTTNLKVYDNSENKNGGKEVHKVGQVLSVECFPQSSNFVLPGCKKVEEGNHCTFKLRS